MAKTKVVNDEKKVYIIYDRYKQQVLNEGSPFVYDIKSVESIVENYLEEEYGYEDLSISNRVEEEPEIVVYELAPFATVDVKQELIIDVLPTRSSSILP